MPFGITRNRRLLAILASTGLLMSLFPSIAVAAGLPGPPTTLLHVQPSAEDGNLNCRPGDGEIELRINAPGSGEASLGGFVVDLDVYNTSEGQAFDFEVLSGGSIQTIYVKAGPDTNVYDFGSAASEDHFLHGTINPKNGKFYGLSHISICFNTVANPTLTTNASADVTIGGTINDVATLSGATATAGGSITFELYGPDDIDCSGTNLVANDLTFTVAVSGDDDYTSPNFTPNAAGTYRWIANYSGDANNNSTANLCNEANESVVVSLNQPSLSTAPNVLPNDKATLSGLLTPSGGSITFELYFNDDCDGEPVAEWSSPVNADGDFFSSNTTNFATADTVISWIVTYSGDANNAEATSGCDAEQADVDFTPLQIP